MAFDIRRLDRIEDCDEKAFYDYQESLLELFVASPEGQAHREKYPEIGFWAAQLMYYGYIYDGVTLPTMTEDDVEYILADYFPRKISTSSPEETQDALPELIAFWEYLKREYGLRAADKILAFLRGVEIEDFKRAMLDPAKFDMAKSFVMMGQEAGFDMPDEGEIDAFMHLYNASLMAQSVDLDVPGLAAESGVSEAELYDALKIIPGGDFDVPQAQAEDERSKQRKAKEKRKRKEAKAARKRSRKKKRKRK